MKITDVQSAVVSIPLHKPTAFATTVVTAREYVVAWVQNMSNRQILQVTFPTLITNRTIQRMVNK